MSLVPTPQTLILRALFLEAGNDVFIQVVAGDDHRLGKPCVIEYFARLDAQPRQVPESRTDPGHLVAVFTQPLARLHRITDAFQRVIRVHEKTQLLGIALA